MVLKRDGSSEDFDVRKLASVLWRVLAPQRRKYKDAVALATAVEFYLQHRHSRCVSSAAVLEMSLRVLRRVGLEKSACSLEQSHVDRCSKRRRLHVRHDGGRMTSWDKNWLVNLTCRVWDVSRSTGRLVAGEIEHRLLESGCTVIARQAIVNQMNAGMESLGLADAVPVRQYAIDPIA
jgi:hypothetical protein